jgi:hypothetical protein
MEKKSIDKIFNNGDEIDRAMRIAVAQAFLQHKKAGNPVVAWQDGKIVWIQPEDISS